jgi:tRNA pseudouridine55 synthase
VTKAKGILPIWQPVGFSTHQITKKVSEKFKSKATHTGTLDPLAEGVIINLLDEERFNKIEFAGWKKTYEFEIAFGLATDSYDAMGMITKTAYKKIKKEKVEQAIEKFKGEYTQKVPLYSAVKYKGKRLFTYARQGRKIPLPEKKGEIYQIKLLKISEKNVKETALNILEKLENITGDFRQEPIIKNWKKYIKTLEGNETFTVAKITAQTSRGIYIRSLSQDIAQKLNSPGFTLSLVRTKNGKYFQKDCKTLEEIFGKKFDKSELTSVVNL